MPVETMAEVISVDFDVGLGIGIGEADPKVFCRLSARRKEISDFRSDLTTNARPGNTIAVDTICGSGYPVGSSC